jgi:hypothetical protein
MIFTKGQSEKENLKNQEEVRIMVPANIICKGAKQVTKGP